MTLVAGFLLAILATTVITLMGRALGWVTLDDITGPRPGTAFIYTPDRWSVIVAIIAAAAGVLSLTSARVGGLSGVFISVTTIPAAANVALGLAFGVWTDVVGSSLQLVGEPQRDGRGRMAHPGAAADRVVAGLGAPVPADRPPRLRSAQTSSVDVSSPCVPGRGAHGRSRAGRTTISRSPRASWETTGSK